MKKDYSALAKYFADTKETYCNMNDGFAAERYMAANAQTQANEICVNTGIKQSTPYIITVTNASTVNNGTFTLFGANWYIDTTRHGCSTDVSASVSLPAIVVTATGDSAPNGYRGLLQQTMVNKFTSKLWRMDVASSLTTSNALAQLQQVMQVMYIDGNGDFAGKTIAIPTKRNIFAFNGGTSIEFEYETKIDGGTAFSGVILPGISITFTISPSGVIDTAQSLMGTGQINKMYSTAGLESYLPSAMVQAGPNGKG